MRGCSNNGGLTAGSEGERVRRRKGAADAGAEIHEELELRSIGAGVRPDLLYREFTRVRTERCPTPGQLSKIRQALGADTMEKVNERLVAVPIPRRVTRGRRMRVDTTAVETNVHYETDSSLLGDGVRTIIGSWAKSTRKSVRER
jgi:hypothetical protein